MEPKQEPYCTDCGSDHIIFYIKADIHQGDWRFLQDHDNRAECMACGSTSWPEWRDIKP